MKKIYKYSEKKFSAFNKNKQLSIIYEMLVALEKSYDNHDYRNELQNSILDCFAFASTLIAEHNIEVTTLANFEQVTSMRNQLSLILDKNLRDSDIVVKRYDKQPESSNKFPLILVLDNLRSAFNVGSIIRVAECLGVQQVILVGNTPGINNKKVIDTSMGTVDVIDIEHSDDIFTAINTLKKQGYEICALELTNSSIPLEEYIPKGKCALILGNESLGISENVISECDYSLEIPMHGWKNSLNVANATSIATYTIISKMEINHDK